MVNNNKDSIERGAALDALIANYLTRIDAGEEISPQQFLSDHPAFVPELRSYFDNLAMVEKLSDTRKPLTGETVQHAPSPVPQEVPADKTPLDHKEVSITQTSLRGTENSDTSVTNIHQKSTANVKSLSIPKMFGRYEIKKVLGQGAMGAVYLARDTQLQRDVALKIPKFGDLSHVDEEEMLARFYREARAAATLRSPHICPVYDVGEIDGQHYITMAFIEGRPLKDFTKSDKQHSEKQIATTIRKLALGLAEAHEIGVIHRDLKPANIMVDKKGEPVVMDFGLARRNSSDDVQVTQSNAILGTPAYMSPEQVAGEHDLIGPQSDIYSLGIIMYELITGEMPFKGNLMAILQQISLNNPKKPSLIRTDIDPRLEKICLKMMAGDLKRRYRSMNDVAVDLQECLRHPARQKSHPSPATQPKPTSIPTAHEESNPALISIEQPKSYAELLREKKGKASSKSKIAGTLSTTPRGNVPSKNVLIAGGIGGLLLLFGVVFLIRIDKYDVEITLDDPSIQLSVDGDALVIRDGKEVKKLSAGEHKLKLQAGSLMAEVDDFIVTKDGKTTLQAKVVNAELNVFRNQQQIYPDPAKTKVAVSPPSKNVDLARGLVGHWGFDGVTGTRVDDSSGKFHHGEATGPIDWKAEPSPSPFSGKHSLRIENSLVSIPASPALATSNSMAFSIWCKLDSTAPNPDRNLVDWGPLQIRCEYDRTWNQHGRLVFVYAVAGVEETQRKESLIIEDLFGGPWFHLVVNCEGNQSTLWVNGKLAHTGQFPGLLTQHQSNLTLGRQLFGSLDDVRFYNRALNVNEIQALTGSQNSADPFLPLLPSMTEQAPPQSIIPRSGWIDLIQLVDPQQDSEFEGWYTDRAAKEGAEFILGHRTSLALPLQMQGSYEIQAEFTISDGPKILQIELPVEGRRPVLILAEHDNQDGHLGEGLSTIDGARAVDPANPTHSKQNLLKHNQRQRLDLKVSHHVVTNQVSIQASIDGKMFVKWSGDPNSLPALNDKNDRRLKLQIYKGSIRFHSLSLKMLNGSAVLTRSALPNQTQMFSATEPASDESNTGFALHIKPQKMISLPLGPASLPPKSTFTIEFWCQPDQSQYPQYSHIVDAHPITIQYLNGDAIHATIGSLLKNSFETSGRAVTAGKWVHLAAVNENGEQVTLYFDGQQVDRRRVEGSASDLPLSEILLGNPSMSFSGLVDELRLSAGVRYRSNFTPQRTFVSDAETIALYHFDEGQGETLHDASDQRNAAWAANAELVTTPGVPLTTDSVEWVDLFNGSDLTGWRVMGKGDWKVANGVLIGESTEQSGWLMTEQEYQNFELEFEYLLSPESNSGVFLRAWPTGALAGNEFHEIQLLDDTAEKFASLTGIIRTGSLFKQIAANPELRPEPNTWHHMRIKVYGNALQVWLNQILITRGNLPEKATPASHLGLQLYPHHVEFRAIRVRELDENGRPVRLDDE